MDTQQNVEYASPHNFIGHRFGKLESIGLVNGKKKKGRIYCILFRCDCGKHRKVSVKTLQTQGMPYEGCKRCQKAIPADIPPDYEPPAPKPSLREQYKSEYRTWCRDKSRLCSRWRKSFKHFIEDMGPRPPGKVLCKRYKRFKHGPKVSYWGTASERNTTRFLEYEGIMYTASEFSKAFSIPLKFVEYHFMEYRRSADEVKWRWLEAIHSGRADEYNNQ